MIRYDRTLTHSEARYGFIRIVQKEFLRKTSIRKTHTLKVFEEVFLVHVDGYRRMYGLRQIFRKYNVKAGDGLTLELVPNNLEIILTGLHEPPSKRK
jgi:hypothetical protein